MAARLPIGLGDLAAAVTRLDPQDNESLLGILAALDLHFEQPHRKFEHPPGSRASSVASRRRDRSATPLDKPTDPLASPALTGSPVEAELVLVRDATRAMPAWLSSVAPLARDLASDTNIIPRAPLIEPVRARAVLGRALAVPISEGPIDVEAVTRVLAECRPLDRLPRLSLTTVRRGAQVLIDLSDAMSYFDVDRWQITENLKDLVGADRIELLGFEGCPTRGVFREGEFEPRPYLPPNDCRVVVLTDFGQTRLFPSREMMPTLGEWTTFAQSMRSGGHPLTVICPYSPARIPRPILDSIRLIHWDRDPPEQHYSQADPIQVGDLITDDTDDALRWLARRNPQAFQLAMLLSPAARIEPALLRAARLELFPLADTATEVDVWFSPLAAARNPTALAFRSKILLQLRYQLATSPALVRMSREFLTRFRSRSGLPHLLLVEEELTFLGIERPDGFERAAAERIAAVLRSLISTQDVPEAERVGMANWAAGAIPEMAPEIAATQAARELRFAANLLLAARALPKSDADLPQDFEAVGSYIPGVFPVTKIGLRMTTDGIELSDPPTGNSLHLVGVPATHPRLLRLRRQGGHYQNIRLAASQRKTLSWSSPGPLTLQTLDGREFELRPSLVPKSPSRDWKYDLFVSYNRLDNNDGFVQELVEVIEKQFLARTGRPLRIYADWEDIPGNEPFENRIRHALERSALLVVVISPHYIRSEWNSRELKLFTASHPLNDGSVFAVYRAPVSSAELPPPLNGLLGYKLFEYSANENRSLPHSLIPHSAATDVMRLTEDIAMWLAQRAHAEPPRQIPRSGTVLFGNVTDDLLRTRQQLELYLEELGANVFTMQEDAFPVPREEYQRQFDERLARATVFVQLLGAFGIDSTSEFPEGVMRWEYERAKANGVVVLRWRPEDLALDKIWVDDHRRFVAASDVIATGLVEFQRLLADELMYRELPLDKTPRESLDPLVIVHYDKSDKSLADEIMRTLNEMNCEVVLSRNDHDFESSFSAVLPSGVLIACGSCSSGWLLRALQLMRRDRVQQRSREKVVYGIWRDSGDSHHDLRISLAWMESIIGSDRDSIARYVEAVRRASESIDLP